jgi:hypothetical protein
MVGEEMRPVDNAIEYVRAHPKKFFREGKFTAVELAMDLVREALQCGVPSVEVVRHDRWTIVHSPDDWLGESASAAFVQIVPFPEGGPNAMRMEVLATAFAREVLTKVDGRVEQIAGPYTPSVLESYADRGRAVAFLS